MASKSASTPKSYSIDVLDPTSKDLADLHRDPEVAASADGMPVRLIEPVSRASVGTTGDGSNWGINAIHANRRRWTGEGVTVAVLDTGIDRAHDAFNVKGLQLIEEDFTGEGNGDEDGHGTHCAGTIFGRDVGGVRIGVAPKIKRALIGKVLDRNGNGTTDQVIRGIQWAAREGAHVVSLSLRFDFTGYVAANTKNNDPDMLRAVTSKALELYRSNLRIFDALGALIRAQHDGCLLVAATGNDSDRPKIRVTAGNPAESDGFLSVGAIQPGTGGKAAFEIAPFSNANAMVAAPGVGILSAEAGTTSNLVGMDGTSMAVPHVAGVAARWAQFLQAESGRIKASEVLAKITGTAQRHGLAPGDVRMGVVESPK